MKLAVFFPASLFSAWACSYGLVDCLKRMGHEVTSVPIDPATQKIDHHTMSYADGKTEGVIISGPEHIGKVFRSSKPAIPTVAWLHETVEREDYGKLDVEAIKRSADIVFCPATQDEKYGFRYLPFGVDTAIFHSHDDCTIDRDGPWCVTCQRTVPDSPKSIAAAFIGLLYPKRQAFLAELKKQGVNLVTGNVQVLELGGVNPRKTAQLYAENIRKIKVFVNLPTLSQLAVTKIYEVLTCGTPILTPEVSDMRNLDGLNVLTYKTAEECAENVAALLKDGYLNQSLVEGQPNPHRLELRCERLLSALKEVGAKSSDESLTTA